MDYIESGDGELEARTLRKVAWKLIPILALAYLVNYIDRTNVGLAALQMNRDLGLTPTQFGTAAGIFYLGYCALELPSNLALYRFGARRWIARIMITWGFCATATAFVTGPVSYNLVRFLEGAAEAGFFPGVVFYLATWFPLRQRTKAMGWFLVAIPLSSVVSGPISGAVLQMGDVMGLRSWQWMFLLEGLPACALGVVILFVLSDGPLTAPWLQEDERAALLRLLAREQRPSVEHDVWRAMVDPRVWIMTAILFSYSIGLLGIGVWLPQIVKAQGLSNFQTGLVTAIPYLLASVAVVIWARVLSHSGRYILNLAIALTVGLAGFSFSVVFPPALPALLGLSLGVIGLSAVRTAFYTLPTKFLTGAAAAGGLALINGLGNAGGFVGPFMMGWLKDTTGSYTAGLIGMSGMLAVALMLTMLMRIVAGNE